MLKTFAHRLASLQSPAWLPPALLLLALSSVFIFGAEHRGYFYRGGAHTEISAKNLAIAENLSPEHHFLMFTTKSIDTDGELLYKPYNRFPIGGYALIKLAILPFGVDLSAKIYAARMVMLLFFAAAAVLAYLSLRRLAASRWIALTATLLAFSSAYCLYYSDAISSETAIDIFAVMLAFHGMVSFEQEGRFRQLIIKIGAALLLGWHVYALLLPFIAFGLMRELINARSSGSIPSSALRQLKHATLSLLRSRYLTLGVVALLFGVSVLTFNFTNEYFALNRETPLTELPSFKSMIYRTGVESIINTERAGYLSWPAFTERQFYRVGAMSLPYAFSPSNLEAPRVQYPGELARSFIVLGIAASGASLIGLLFARRDKILLASLALSGFCWALPMRHNVADPYHNHEAIFYIGVALTMFSLVLLYLRRLSGERFVATLSVAALLVFALSALRMSQLSNSYQLNEFNKAAIADFQTIRDMTDGNTLQINAKIRGYDRNTIDYYLAGSSITYTYRAGLSTARPPDFVATDMRADGIASFAPKNRMIFLYEWGDYHRYISESIERSEPLIRAAFDVYIVDNALVYVKDDCRENDLSEKFFLAVHPSVKKDLLGYRRQHGFDNLDFYFKEHAVWLGKRCIAVASIPEYDIARIHTGQYIQRADGSFEHLWEGDVRLTEIAR